METAADMTGEVRKKKTVEKKQEKTNVTLHCI